MSVQEWMTLTACRPLAEGIYEMTLQGDVASRVLAPGQFVHIRPPESLHLLRRPISICCVDQDKGELTLIFRVGGAGTALLAALSPGTKIDVLGPLGNGFPLEAARAGARALLIGGGVGVPPLYGLSRALVERGIITSHVLGFRTAADVFYTKQFSQLGAVQLFTEDGSMGRRGFVTEATGSVMFEVAYACGPLPMLCALERQLAGKLLYLSLEARMACGIGACYACAVHTSDTADQKGYLRVCVDGPVFRAGEVKLC
ncbi:MAG: dihydroorotate dehydrogenase electron transfer subunit [Sporolactobacillus sp.]